MIKSFKAFVLSSTEIHKYFEQRHLAFINPYVCENAELNSEGQHPFIHSGLGEQCDQHHFETQDKIKLKGRGYGVTRTCKKVGTCWSDYSPLFVNQDGEIKMFSFPSGDAALRVACMPIYDEKSKLMKSLKYEPRTSFVWATGRWVEDTLIADKWGCDVTNVAPIIEDNGIKYIWLNEEECKNKTSKAMLISTLDYVACADKVILTEKEVRRGKVMQPLYQAENWAERYMSNDLKASLVSVDISDEIAKPIFENSNYRDMEENEG